jgi:uncharacterized protein (UPF0261 family)
MHHVAGTKNNFARHIIAAPGEHMGRVYVVGTADTKADELAYLRSRIAAAGATPLLVDVGTRGSRISVDVAAATVAASGDSAAARSDDRGTAVAAMSHAFASFIVSRPDIDAIVGIGGGGGTSIVTAGMRALPIGLPKLMVSTLASGDTSGFVGISDIVMMPAIADFAGLSSISRLVLDRAAAAIVAMSKAAPSGAGKPAIGLTMFGVTTPAVTQVVSLLGDEFDAIPFHATGTGGRTMEALVDSGLISGVIDITTTEVADFLFGGVLPAGPDRLDCIARTGVPYVGSLGACDMINFWARDAVPAEHAGRNLYVHNANVTLMRTTPEECRAIGAWIGNKLNACDGPVRFLIPEMGVSTLDIAGGAFWDPAADEQLFSALAETVRWTANRQLIRVPTHINDPDFARAAVAAFKQIWP